jgi:hypothetical protein
MKKLTTILFSLIGISTCYSQETCVFEVIDTIHLKKGYYALLTDESNKRIGVFTTNKKDALSFGLHKIDEYTQYFPSSVLERKIILSKTYAFEDISNRGIKGVEGMVIKDREHLRVYRLDSERGFVI